MTQDRIGLLAVIGACTIWGLSPIYYKELSHIPATDVMAHRVIWSLVFFLGVLALQGRLRAVSAAFSGPRRFGIFVVAALMISANWFLFIYATQVDLVTETSLGYYAYPLVAVLVGRFFFGERLSPLQWTAVSLAGLAVACLSLGLGAAPWISLALATTFGLYGVIKKQLELGPVVSVTCEVAVVAPVAFAILVFFHGEGQGWFGGSIYDAVLLILSGPLTALPLILFSAAARRIRMSTLGVLQYINPTLQFFCAVVLFGEPFTIWYQIAFVLIWTAVALYSVSALRQDRAARRV